MKKKILFVPVLFLFIIFWYIIHLYENNKFNISEVEGITIAVKNDSLTRSGATIIITDLNGNKYDEWYKTEKYDNKKWTTLKTKV